MPDKVDQQKELLRVSIESHDLKLKVFALKIQTQILPVLDELGISLRSRAAFTPSMKQVGEMIQKDVEQIEKVTNTLRKIADGLDPSIMLSLGLLNSLESRASLIAAAHNIETRFSLN